MSMSRVGARALLRIVGSDLPGNNAAGCMFLLVLLSALPGTQTSHARSAEDRRTAQSLAALQADLKSGHASGVSN
jgi:hypothetical protein